MPNRRANVTPNRLPAALPGFEGVTRRWDITHGVSAARLLPGEFYVTRENEVITTVLGSCISACIRDPRTGVGGMNHFMLPGDDASHRSTWGGQACMVTRYGIAAMESLINEILKCGARKADLEVKLFGGADVLEYQLSRVGMRNIAFARQFVAAESISIEAEDLGGRTPRKIRYFPKTGRVLVRRLQAVQNKAILEREKEYECTLEQTATSGEIELFD